MRTTIFSQIVGIVLMLLLGSGLQLSAQDNESFFTVSGVVKDSHTNKKLNYVNVTVPGTNVGTVTNADGYFTLKIKYALHAKEVEISHLGYLNYRFEVSGDVIGTTILLIPSAKLLQEITVRPDNSRQLVEQAIDRIGDNYSKTPTLFSAFYRETVQKGKRYIQVAEAVIDVYKSRYDESIDRDRVRIFKGRKLLAPQKNDTLAVKLMGGPYFAVLLDVVKNPDILLDKEALSMYDFTMEDPISINNRLQYVISFKPAVTMPYALYYGRYYIDRETLAFTQIAFNLDMSDLNKATEAMLVKKPTGLHFKPYEFSFLVTYKQQNGVSYLNYIRSEASFKCDWKRRLFSSKYNVVSEMVMTDRADQGVKPFPFKESFTKNEAFSDKVSAFFDPDFWGAYNIIEPTESLDAAVTKLKKAALNNSEIQK
jgi:hypothetical protein